MMMMMMRGGGDTTPSGLGSFAAGAEQSKKIGAEDMPLVWTKCKRFKVQPDLSYTLCALCAAGILDPIWTAVRTAKGTTLSPRGAMRTKGSETTT